MSLKSTMEKVAKIFYGLVLIFVLVNKFYVESRPRRIVTREILSQLKDFEMLKEQGVEHFLMALTEYDDIEDEELLSDLVFIKALVALKGFDALEHFEVIKVLAVLAKLKIFKLKALKLKALAYHHFKDDEESEEIHPRFPLIHSGKFRHYFNVIRFFQLKFNC